MLLRNEEPFYVSHKNKNNSCIFKNQVPGTFLVVQWLRFHNPNVGDLGSIDGQEAGSQMPQLRLGITKYIFFSNLFFNIAVTRDGLRAFWRK